MEKFGRLFSIRKTYFLQVERLILVGTLEKCMYSLQLSGWLYYKLGRIGNL
ncbi:hypothetical protein LEP1GSC021_0344 [Leptospira noguchii str. 1993005606]|nr:hypothetical protein LEP1GSC021_0344 [Leptospira noguchii str. 1993005606]